MDEMDIVRRLHLFYMFRRDNLLKKMIIRKWSIAISWSWMPLWKAQWRQSGKDERAGDYFQVTPLRFPDYKAVWEKGVGGPDSFGYRSQKRLYSGKRGCPSDDEKLWSLYDRASCRIHWELGEEDANAFVRILEKALAYSQKRKEKLEEGEQKWRN